MTQCKDCAPDAAENTPVTRAEFDALLRQTRMLAGEFLEFAETQRSEFEDRASFARMADNFARIIGGRKVDPGAFPECCMIGNTSAGGFLKEWFCTGTLIHPRVVVTADHCITRSNGALDPNSIAIGIEEQTEITRNHIHRILKIIRHPIEDIALLILQKASTITPVSIATTVEVESATNVHLVGFGNSDAAGLIGYGTKREVNVPMQWVKTKPPHPDLDDAAQALGFDPDTEFVAGRKGSGQDSCTGDSGGPAYIRDGAARALAGATSRATDEHNDVCGDGGVYVRLDAVRPWIDGILARY